jgi:HD-GYP domain-containing protein (c-di-GMP phosphodiesterase class II)
VVSDRIVDHVIQGARAAEELELPPAAVEGIATHHEHWDGGGYPRALSGDAIPIVGRVVCAADHIESLIDETTPLLARRNLGHWLGQTAGVEADPHLVGVLRDITWGDSFWLGLFGDSVQEEISKRCSRLREPKGLRLEPFLESFSRLVDSRFAFTAGVSRKVARLVEALGRAAGLPDIRIKQLRIAALLHDLGQLAVSERIMAKPDILSVEELEVLHQHPSYSRDIIAGMHGLEEVADWVAAHHEWLDGRGYPDARSGADIPTEARILAVVDFWVGVTSDRPHRKRMDAAEARRQLRAAAGTHLDVDLVDIFLREVVA